MNTNLQLVKSELENENITRKTFRDYIANSGCVSEFMSPAKHELFYDIPMNMLTNTRYRIVNEPELVAHMSSFGFDEELHVKAETLIITSANPIIPRLTVEMWNTRIRPYLLNFLKIDVTLIHQTDEAQLFLWRPLLWWRFEWLELMYGMYGEAGLNQFPESYQAHVMSEENQKIAHPDLSAYRDLSRHWIGKCCGPLCMGCRLLHTMAIFEKNVLAIIEFGVKPRLLDKEYIKKVNGKISINVKDLELYSDSPLPDLLKFSNTD